MISTQIRTPDLYPFASSTTHTLFCLKHGNNFVFSNHVGFAGNSLTLPFPAEHCPYIHVFPLRAQGILSEVWPDDAIFKHRGQNHLEQSSCRAATGQPAASPASPPCGAPGRKEQTGVPQGNQGSHITPYHSAGGWIRASLHPFSGPPKAPTAGDKTLSSVSTSILQQEHQRPRAQGKVGIELRGPAAQPQALQTQKANWVPCRRGPASTITGLRLFSAMTLASSWDWGLLDFTSCRFCSRICVERRGGTVS